MGNLKKENNSCLTYPPLQTSAVHMKHPTNNGGGGFQTKESTPEKTSPAKSSVISMAKRDTVS